MFLLCTLFFALFLYNIFKLYPSRKTIDDAIELNCTTENKDKKNDNVVILDKLGYYNLNVNDIRFCFVSECMNYLLYCDNPNYTKTDFLTDCCGIDDTQITNFCNDFENFCLKIHKNKMDFTVNEIVSFVKKSDIYKILDQELGLKLKRAVILSKFTNEVKTEKLINALTIDELNLLCS